jgi:dihydroflavonol-4-reductase
MILVTGATGLVGSHLVLHLLEKNEKVRAIYRNSNSIAKTKSLFQLYNKEAEFGKIEWVLADITDVPSLELVFENINSVYHCAALISFDPKEENQLRKINIEGTANIVNFCLAKKIQKLCYVSSIAALGDLKEGETILNEESEWNSEKYHSDYAISKYGAEIEIWRGQQEGLEVVIVNPGVILGPGFWEAGSGILYPKVRDGLPFYTKGATGFISVNDVVKAMFQLMKKDVNGQRFILISENIGFETLLNTIAKSLDVKPPTVYAKPWMTGILWRLDWISSSLFFTKRKLSRAMAESLDRSDLISNEKVKLELDFEFENILKYSTEVAAFLKK